MCVGIALALLWPQLPIPHEALTRAVPSSGALTTWWAPVAALFSGESTQCTALRDAGCADCATIPGLFKDAGCTVAPIPNFL